MHIYFRACEKQQTISNVVRFNNISKTEIIKRCWKSIQASITNQDTIIIIHDDVSSMTLQWLLDTCNTSNIRFIEVPEHSWDYHLHTVKLLEVLAEQVVDYPDELHYIVEDDYLHTENAIRVLEDTLKFWNHFAVSYDYPDRYTMNPQPAMIMLGHDRHWRTVESSTMTVLAKGSTWSRVLEVLKTAGPTSNDHIFLNIYKQEPCISPLPGVSSHMTDYHLTPLVDWSAIWNIQNV